MHKDLCLYKAVVFLVIVTFALEVSSSYPEMTRAVDRAEAMGAISFLCTQSTGPNS